MLTSHVLVVSVYPLQASWCFNAMISPLLPMSLKGVVWSQGEQVR